MSAPAAKSASAPATINNSTTSEAKAKDTTALWRGRNVHLGKSNLSIFQQILITIVLAVIGIVLTASQYPLPFIGGGFLLLSLIGVCGTYMNYTEPNQLEEVLKQLYGDLDKLPELQLSQEPKTKQYKLFKWDEMSHEVMSIKKKNEIVAVAVKYTTLNNDKFEHRLRVFALKGDYLPHDKGDYTRFEHTDREGVAKCEDYKDDFQVTDKLEAEEGVLLEWDQFPLPKELSEDFTKIESISEKWTCIKKQIGCLKNQHFMENTAPKHVVMVIINIQKFLENIDNTVKQSFETKVPLDPSIQGLINEIIISFTENDLSPYKHITTYAVHAKVCKEIQDFEDEITKEITSLNIQERRPFAEFTKPISPSALAYQLKKCAELETKRRMYNSMFIWVQNLTYLSTLIEKCSSESFQVMSDTYQNCEKFIQQVETDHPNLKEHFGALRNRWGYYQSNFSHLTKVHASLQQWKEADKLSPADLETLKTATKPLLNSPYPLPTPLDYELQKASENYLK